MAAYSKAEVGRARGCRPSQLFNLSETGNDVACRVARGTPGVVFVSSNNGGTPKPENYLETKSFPSPGYYDGLELVS